MTNTQRLTPSQPTSKSPNYNDTDSVAHTIKDAMGSRFNPTKRVDSSQTLHIKTIFQRQETVLQKMVWDLMHTTPLVKTPSKGGCHAFLVRSVSARKLKKKRNDVKQEQRCRQRYRTKSSREPFPP